MSMSRCLVSVSSTALVISGMLLTIPRTGWAQIEEIVVTTRKKTESLQDIPIAVSTLGAQQIKRQGIRSIADVTKLSPSVQFDQSFGPADTRVAIRGLSNTRGRSNVAFLVDGVDITTENVISAGSGLLVNQRLLNDVERIEVVKGPQSALYGRAAFAGAISYITKEPGDELETKLSIDAADHGQYQFDGSVSGPVKGLEDVLALRASGVYWKEDGFFKNSVSGQDVGGGEGWGGALTGVFRPADAIKIKARVEYSKEKLRPRPAVRTGGGTQGANLELLEFPVNAVTPFCDAVLADPDSPQSQKDQCLSGQNFQVDFAFCDSLTDPVERDNCLAGKSPDGTMTVVDVSGQGRYIDPTLPCVPLVPGQPCTEPGQLDAPENTLNPNIVVPPLGYGSDTATGLLDFDQFCPPELRDPSKGPGFCVPSSMGEVDDHVKPNGDLITFSEDPFTGKDYPGTRTELLRATIQAEIDMGYGTFTSLTGWTDFNTSDKFDQDNQASGRPDLLASNWLADTDGSTQQFSQELRFQSSFEGPYQFALGGFFWEEERATTDRNYIIACLNHSVNKLAQPGTPDSFPTGPDGRFPAASGLCDGTPDTVDSLARPTITAWQQMALALPPCLFDSNGDPIPDPTGKAGCQQGQRAGAPWRADTEHWSIYGSFDFELAENWTVTLEDRYINETFDLLRPNFSSCSNIALPITQLFSIGLPQESNPVTTAAEDVVCRSEGFLNPNLPSGFDVAGGLNWTLIEGSESSSFHTPKVTVRWLPTDDAMLYFSWAVGQKPGGINQLAAGGTPTTIENERFDSERQEAWEIGWKTAWEAAGFLQVNGAFFFNDYTDKQIGTQVVREQGGQLSLQPVVVNAAAAEVWGAEVEFLWQPKWVEGLNITLAYTFLNAEFVDFKDDTRSLLRSAEVGNCEVVWKDSNDNLVDPNSLFALPSDDTDNLPAGTPTLDAQQFCRLDLSGNKLERSPENAFVFNLNYTAQFGSTGTDWFAETNVTYEDERFVSADNSVKFDDYYLVDMRLGLTGEQWEFLIYVDNVFDDDTIRTGGGGPDFATQVEELGFTAGLGVGNFFGVLPDPRVAGVRMTFMF